MEMIIWQNVLAGVWCFLLGVLFTIGIDAIKTSIQLRKEEKERQKEKELKKIVEIIEKLNLDKSKK